MDCEKNFSPVGLLIEMKKVPRDREKPPALPYGLVIGHYNQLSFKLVYNWSEFSPESISRRKTENEFCDVGDQYPIRLCFPAEEKRAILELPHSSKGDSSGTDIYFWYRDWMENTDKLTALIKENPCVTVVLVNLTDSFKYGNGKKKNTFSDLLTDFREVLIGTLKNNAELCAKLMTSHCCVLPCLGYADYAILFAEKKWDAGILIPSALHQAIDNNGTPILSTDYSLPVYFYDGGDVPTEGLFSDDTYLACRLALRSGYKIEDVRDALNECNPEPKEALSVDYCEINDVADYHLIAKSPRDSVAILRLLLRSRGFLIEENGQNPEKDMILVSKSRLQHKVTLGSSTGSSAQKNLPSVTELDDLKHVLILYYKILKEKGYNLRQANALLDTERTLRNVCMKNHGKDLYTVLKPLLVAFTQCMTDLKQAIEPDNSKVTQEHWEDIGRTLELFRERVGGFVRDLSRSDCFTMECEQYNHSSVGSSTLLLLGLNRVINCLAADLQDQANDITCKHGFLVTSGGCDRTITRRMFFSLVPKKPKYANMKLLETLPFIMQVSELGLFDCSSTLFRLVHEVFHYCGERLRTQRAASMQKFLCTYIDRPLAEASLKSYEERFIAWSDTIAVTDEEKKKLGDVFSGAYNELSCGIQNLVITWWEKYSKESSSNSTFYMSRKYKMWLREATNRLLNDEAFVDDLTNLVISYRKHHLQECCKAWKSQFTKKPPYSIFDNVLTHEAAMLKRESTREMLLKEIKNLIVFAWPKSPGSRIDSIQCIFSEAFSDMAACTVLNATPVDYLLCFMGEGRTIDDTLADSYENTCRISAVLDVVWDIREGLSNSVIHENLKASVNMLWPGDSERTERCEKMVQRVDEMIELQKNPKEEERHKIICEYLNSCIAKLKVDPKKFEPYQMLFKKTRLHESEQSHAEAVCTMLEALDTFGEGVVRCQ